MKKCLNTNAIDVRKLVRKDADLEQLAFISFKIGVDLKLKDLALDPATWPICNPNVTFGDRQKSRASTMEHQT